MPPPITQGTLWGDLIWNFSLCNWELSNTPPSWAFIRKTKLSRGGGPPWSTLKKKKLLKHRRRSSWSFHKVDSNHRLFGVATGEPQKKIDFTNPQVWQQPSRDWSWNVSHSLKRTLNAPLSKSLPILRAVWEGLHQRFSADFFWPKKKMPFFMPGTGKKIHWLGYPGVHRRSTDLWPIFDDQQFFTTPSTPPLLQIQKQMPGPDHPQPWFDGDLFFPRIRQQSMPEIPVEICGNTLNLKLRQIQRNSHLKYFIDLVRCTVSLFIVHLNCQNVKWYKHFSEYIFSEYIFQSFTKVLLYKNYKIVCALNNLSKMFPFFGNPGWVKKKLFLRVLFSTKWNDETKTWNKNTPAVIFQFEKVLVNLLIFWILKVLTLSMIKIFCPQVNYGDQWLLMPAVNNWGWNKIGFEEANCVKLYKHMIINMIIFKQ